MLARRSLFASDPFFAPFRLLEQELGNAAAVSEEQSAFAPAVDVLEAQDKLVIEAELAGVRPEDVSIEVEGRVLTLSGERKPKHTDDNNARLRAERSYGAFVRRFTLGETYDLDNVKADLEHGVLHVEVAKRPEEKPRRIQVGGGAAGSETIDA